MTIRINGLLWTIEEVDTRSQELVINGNSCFGVCQYVNQRILIDNSIKDDKKYQTLKHELAHAFLYCYTLDKKDTFNEEELCEFVAMYSDAINDFAKEYMEVMHHWENYEFVCNQRKTS